MKQTKGRSVMKIFVDAIYYLCITGIGDSLSTFNVIGSIWYIIL
jgi:hypothetical protein